MFGSIYLIIPGAAALAALPPIILGKRGRHFILWYIYGLALFPFAMLHAIVQKEKQSSEIMELKGIIETMMAAPDQTKAATYMIDVQIRFFDPLCPVEIDAIQLKIDVANRGASCQFTFRNIGEREIQAMKLDVFCYNSFNEEAGEPLELLIQDCAGLSGQIFSPGGYFILEGREHTRRINAIIRRIVFSDGLVWDAKEGSLRPNQIEVINNAAELAALQEQAGTDAICYARKNPDGWTCVCGRINMGGNRICPRCKRSRDTVLKSYVRPAHNSLAAPAPIPEALNGNGIGFTNGRYSENGNSGSAFPNSSTVSATSHGYPNATAGDNGTSIGNGRENRLMNEFEIRKTFNDASSYGSKRRLSRKRFLTAGTLVLALGLVLVLGFMTDFSYSYQHYKAKQANQMLDNGQSMLTAAAGQGDAQTVQMLIGEGADVNLADKNGQTPLLAALKCEDAGITAALLVQGADISPEQRNSFMQLAAANGDLEALNLYLDYEKLPAFAIDSSDALLAAAAAGQDRIVKLFLEHGANIENKNKEGKTALSLAVDRGHEDAAAILVKEGAELNKTDLSGELPLVNAARRGDLSIVKLLVQYGADPKKKNKNGETALEEADSHNHADVVKYLKGL